MTAAVVIWSRHAPRRDWCAVIGGSDSAARTACGGIWGVGGAPLETHPAPAKHERCDECQRVLVDRAIVERGLAELVADARPVARPFVVVDYSDVDVDVGGVE